jgi:hypothetical protein
MLISAGLMSEHRSENRGIGDGRSTIAAQRRPIDCYPKLASVRSLIGNTMAVAIGQVVGGAVSA